MILLSSSVIIVFYNSYKSNIIDQLENTTFTIADFDIIDYNSTHIEIQSVLKIEDTYFQNRNLNSLDIHSIFVSLSINDTIIGEFEINPGSQEISNDQQIISFVLITDIVENEGLESIAEYLVFGLPLDFHLQGKVIYSYQGIIRDSLEFENKLLFRSSRSINIFVNEIILPEINNTQVNTEIYFYNPFSADFVVRGSAFLLVDSDPFGFIEFPDYIKIVSGGSNYSFFIELLENKAETISKFISVEERLLNMKASLDFNFLSTQVLSEVNFTIATISSDSFQFTIPEVHEFNTEQTEPIIVFDFKLKNSLPADFNVSSLYMEIYTIGSNRQLGHIIWEAPNFSQLVKKYDDGYFANVTAVITDSSLIPQLLFERSLRIPYGMLALDLYGEILEIEFSIGVIQIDI
jgi:hypothetical protein